MEHQLCCWGGAGWEEDERAAVVEGSNEEVYAKGVEEGGHGEDEGGGVERVVGV